MKSENEKRYLFMPAFFNENSDERFALSWTTTGLEIADSRFACIPVYDSIEPGILDGLVLAIGDLVEPC